MPVNNRHGNILAEASGGLLCIGIDTHAGPIRAVMAIHASYANSPAGGGRAGRTPVPGIRVYPGTLQPAGAVEFGRCEGFVHLYR